MNNVDVGTYYQSGGSSSMPVNAPSGGNNAFILVASARNNDRVQFWWSTNAGKLFIRQTVSWSNGGSSDWSEWEAIALDSNITQSVASLSNFHTSISNHNNLSAYKTGNMLTLCGSITTNDAIANGATLFKIPVTPKALSNGILTTQTGLYSIAAQLNGNVLTNVYGTTIPAGTYNVNLIVPI